MEDSYTVYEWEETTNFDILFRCKSNVIQILLHRGYRVRDKEIEEFSWNSYDEYERKRNRCLRRVKRADTTARHYFSKVYSKKGSKLYVVFETEKEKSTKLRAKTMKGVIADAELNHVKNVMLISPYKPNKESVRGTKEAKFTFEFYTDADMCVNRLDNVMAPIAEALTKEEAEEFIERTGIRKGMMPRFNKWNPDSPSTSEPIIQHYQYPAGTIIKLIRENNYTRQISNESVYWRVVA
jgi:DNA-directed RNA polymerase subunit H (RpoH/RPB5)